MSDVMLLGVLRMPYDMAMHDELSRLQFHSRGAEAADRIEADEAELTRLRAEVERLTAALSDERAHADAMEEALERATVYVEGPMADRIGPMVRQCRAALAQHRARRQG